MDEQVERTVLLERMLEFRDQDVIKVLTGVRRCGKSTLLRQYIEKLRSDGVKDTDIIYVNMESLSNIRFQDGSVLYDHIIGSHGKGRTYVFLDDVPFIRGWERVVNSLKTDIDCDIYVTGSNAYFLSTEISTLLTGRSHSFMVLPLSFGEYMDMGRSDTIAGFSDYLHFGGMPFIRPGYGEDVIFQRLNDIRSDIILKDICSRKEKIDSVKVRKVVDYVFSEIGNAISAENIAEDVGLSTSTAADYLELIAGSLLFYRVERYDLRGKSILKTMPKYYCVDLGMRNTQPLKSDRDHGRVLENVVFLELLRRGYQVYVGKAGIYEIDFVTVRNGRVEYYQVSQTIAEPDVRERELRPFRTIRDGGKKYLITAEPVVRSEEEGVSVMGILEFLTGTG